MPGDEERASEQAFTTGITTASGRTVADGLVFGSGRAFWSMWEKRLSLLHEDENMGVRFFAWWSRLDGPFLLSIHGILYVFSMWRWLWPLSLLWRSEYMGHTMGVWHVRYIYS